MSECDHKQLLAQAVGNREDDGTFSVGLKVCCAYCGAAFRFVGLPVAVNAKTGAGVSLDGMCAKLVAVPEGKK